MIVRDASSEDSDNIASFLNSKPNIHKHLDWKTVIDWVGSQPFLILEEGKKIVAILACPPEPPNVAWIRVFAALTTVDPAAVWPPLWDYIVKNHNEVKDNLAVSIAITPWFKNLLLENGFSQNNKIIVLEWTGKIPPPRLPPAKIEIRDMADDDLHAVSAVDRSAFAPVWQNSEDSLKYAFEKSISATVAESETGIVGYQITTATSEIHWHLARLAVAPGMQRSAIGYNLVRRLQLTSKDQGVWFISVNTQGDNKNSQALYRQLNFKLIGEEFPVLYRVI